MRNNSYNKSVNELKMAYTYYLEEKITKIWGMMMNDRVSIDDMKRTIHSYIWNAAYKTSDGTLTKKQWFLDTMNSMDSKKDIYYFCNNSIKRARQTIAR